MIVIDCDQLFDGTSLHGPSRIMIDDGRISEVGDRNDLAAHPGGETVQTAFAMPGLIDAHVHIAGYREGSPVGAPFEPEKNFARLCALAGVTTVRDLGNSVETIAYMREWSLKFQGPRVISSGPILDRPPLAWPFSRMARNGDEVRHAVHQLAGEGLEWIKAYRGVEPEVFGTVVEAATSHNLPVAVHCGRTTASQASDAGTRSLEHISHALPDLLAGHSNGNLPGDGSGYALAWANVDPGGSAATEFVQRLKANGTWMCPTVLVSRRWALIDEMVNEPKLDYAAIVMPYHRELKRMQNPVGMRVGRMYMSRFMPVTTLSRRERKQAEAGLANMAELVVRMHREGVRLVAGTDSPNPSLVPGFSLYDELALLQDAGLSGTEALTLATSAAGELLSDEHAGVIARGAVADVLCLDGDPAHDVRELTTLTGVLARGQWLDLERMRSKLEEAAKR
jgi:imidazolonepropionase-like amidohydrolase